MARQITAAAQAKLDQRIGTEPITIVEVQWVRPYTIRDVIPPQGGGPTPVTQHPGVTFSYCDKNIDGASGKILEVGALDDALVIQGAQSDGATGDSKQISIRLDDTDGTIKKLMDSNDVHKVDAWVYQSFTGLDHDVDKILLFKGQVSSPIEWDEGDRTVAFDILSRVEDTEVGFSIEEASGQNLANGILASRINEDIFGKPWPLAFGQVHDVPVLQVRSAFRGQLVDSFGIPDYMLWARLQQSGQLACPKVEGDPVWVVNSRSGTGGRWQRRFYSDPGCVCKAAAARCSDQLNYNKQASYLKGNFRVQGAAGNFPQGTQITLVINGAELIGHFGGTDESPSEYFILDGTQHTGHIRHSSLVAGNYPPPYKQYNYAGDSDVSSSAPVTSRPGQSTSPKCLFNASACDTLYPADSVDINESLQPGEGAASQSWRYMDEFELQGFDWHGAGSEVYMKGDDTVVYECNLLPSEIKSVKAYRSSGDTNNRRTLTVVPTSFYETRVSDWGVYQITEITMNTALSLRKTSEGELDGWEDELYVSMQTDLEVDVDDNVITPGQNTVDIMKWLISTYTPQFSWDSSFDRIHDLIDGYPMNFVFPGRRNILQALREIAWQARCSILLRNDVFSLIYLPEKPNTDPSLDPDDYYTITEDDVLSKTLRLSHTKTEDIVTKAVFNWKPKLSLEDPYQYIVRTNVGKYGTVEEEYDLYCFNRTQDLQRCAHFWAIRLGNTWRHINFSTPIARLGIQTLDGVGVDLPDIASEIIDCRVDSANYNSANNVIDFAITTPVRAGELTEYPFTYPKDVEEVYPDREDILFGSNTSGPNINISTPEGHVTQGSQAAAGGGVTLPDCNERGDILYTGGGGINDCEDQQPQDDRCVYPDCPTNDQPFDPDGGGGGGNLPPTPSYNFTPDAGNWQGKDDQFLPDTVAGDLDPSDTLDQLEKLPGSDGLDGICQYTVCVYFIGPLTKVRIPKGDRCCGKSCKELQQEQPGYQPLPCKSDAGCPCGAEGKCGGFIGNQTTNENECFIFSDAATRDDFVENVISPLKDAGACVGDASHVAFWNTSSIAGEGCTPYKFADGQLGDETGAVIGYESNGDSGFSLTSTPGSPYL